MAQIIQEWTKSNLWKVAFKNIYLVHEYFVPYMALKINHMVKIQATSNTNNGI